jgi:hypothetical protein
MENLGKSTRLGSKHMLSVRSVGDIKVKMSMVSGNMGLECWNVVGIIYVTML